MEGRQDSNMACERVWTSPKVESPSTPSIQVWKFISQEGRCWWGHHVQGLETHVLVFLLFVSLLLVLGTLSEFGSDPRLCSSPFKHLPIPISNICKFLLVFWKRWKYYPQLFVRDCSWPLGIHWSEHYIIRKYFILVLCARFL